MARYNKLYTLLYIVMVTIKVSSYIVSMVAPGVNQHFYYLQFSPVTNLECRKVKLFSKHKTCAIILDCRRVDKNILFFVKKFHTYS